MRRGGGAKGRPSFACIRYRIIKRLFPRVVQRSHFLVLTQRRFLPCFFGTLSGRAVLSQCVLSSVSRMNGFGSVSRSASFRKFNSTSSL